MKDSTHPAEFFQPGGNLDPESPSYVVREADEALLVLTKSGEYCNVLTARQMGKSSLIVRTQKRLQEEGVHSVVIDLTAIGTKEVSADQWYFSLISDVSHRLRLDIDEVRWWTERKAFGQVQRFTEFLQDVVLKQVLGAIVIFIDEIDSTLNLEFTDDFFVAIRALFNERAANPDYRRLTFVLVGVARPADLIKDRSLPPYNIGRSVDLEDFSAQDAKRLLPGLETVFPRRSQTILERVLHWTGGHPYLTQRVCAELVVSGEDASSDMGVDQLVQRLFFQKGRMRKETNLQWIDDYVRKSEYRESLLQVYRDVLSGKQVRDEERSLIKSQLKLSGLVKATSDRYLRIRNRIYERVFGPQWAAKSEPGRKESTERRGTEAPPLSAGGGRLGVVSLVAVVFVLVAVVALGIYFGRDRATPPPSSTPMATNTFSAVPPPLPTTGTPTPTGTSTATPAEESMPTHKPTETPTSTPEVRLTATPTPTGTPTPSATLMLPTPTPTSTSTPMPTRSPPVSPTSTSTSIPSDTPRPTDTPTLSPTPISPPALIEPESGARFPERVRLKWVWHRRLGENERFVIRWEAVSGFPAPEWWANEDEILAASGAVYPAAGGFLFEAILRIGSYPGGEAYWSVSVFGQTSTRTWQVSQWSERRQIIRGQP